MVASLTESQGRRMLPDSQGLGSARMRRCTGRTSQASGEGGRDPEGAPVSLRSLAEGGFETSSQASLTHSQGRRPLPDLRCLGFRMAHLIGVMRGRAGPECAPVNLRDLAQGGSAG